MAKRKNEFEELVVVTLNERNQQVVSARELHEKLEVKSKFTDWITRRIDNYGFEENVDYICISEVKETQRTNGQVGITIEHDYIITINMAKELCRVERRNSKGAKILQYLLSLDNKEIMIIEPEREEIEFFDALEEFFDPIGEKGGIRQYSVLNYRIDYYIEDYKLAIEYDENDHKGYTYEQQELRQQLIEKELGCKFLRLSSSDSFAYNIGLVTRELLS